MVLVPPVLLIMTLPISIAGWGVREQAMITAFGLVGVSEESALALSILSGLTILAGGLPGGVVWLVETRSGRPALSPGSSAGLSAPNDTEPERE
ncbi:MAG: hypothetical protein FD153_1608 [Rhodospirillaceae bacterium]|nr:MAG: hypothetical protein FD153_1608 [Rhodospirillaceae bacterium]